MQKAAELARAVQADRDAWLQATEERTKDAIKQAKSELATSATARIASGLAPYIDVPAVPLPNARRAEFVAHLRKIIEDSFAAAPGDGPPPPPPDKDPDYAERLEYEAPEHKILDTACIACQGECCLQGNKTHAFLTKDTINYVRWSHPDLDPEDMIDMYLSFMPERSVRDSCVYHGDKGCTLNRPIRADICNSFQCAFRKRLAQNYAENPGYGAVVAGIATDHADHPEAGSDYLRVVSMSEEGDVRIHSDLRLPALKPIEKG